MASIKKNNTVTTKTTKSLTEEAYRRIKLLIFNQEVVPGQKLVYDDLAKRLNMSRTPIINALNRLAQQGLVDAESYRGFTVRPMDNKEAWDSFGFREAMETYTVEHAIVNAGKKEFDILKEKVRIYDDHNLGYYDRKKVSNDIAIHIQIAEMAKNMVLKSHLKLTLQHIYIRARLNNYSMERLEQAHSEHHIILSRMLDKDIQGSIEVMRHHIQEDRKHVIDCISSSSGESIDDEDLMI